MDKPKGSREINNNQVKKGFFPFFRNIVEDVDYEVSSKIQIFRTKIGNYFWKSLSFLGLPFIWSGIVIILFILDIYHMAYVLILAGLSPLLIIIPLKKSINRKRPYFTYEDIKPLTREKNSSFPSGHTYYITVSSFGLAFCYGGTTTLIIATVISILVAVSRVYQGVHYLSDVIIAFFLSIIIGFIISIFFPQIMLLHELSFLI